mmetsp:Transcript_27419/g.63723  ORF Transcript_27419/g.63723 Transcript_27419/m.63723 type:complete len:228 (-) Transcript_27419:51-734(-)
MLSEGQPLPQRSVVFQPRNPVRVLLEALEDPLFEASCLAHLVLFLLRIHLHDRPLLLAYQPLKACEKIHRRIAHSPVELHRAALAFRASGIVAVKQHVVEVVPILRHQSLPAHAFNLSLHVRVLRRDQRLDPPEPLRIGERSVPGDARHLAPRRGIHLSRALPLPRPRPCVTHRLASPRWRRCSQPDDGHKAHLEVHGAVLTTLSASDPPGRSCKKSHQEDPPHLPP